MNASIKATMMGESVSVYAVDSPGQLDVTIYVSKAMILLCDQRMVVDEAVKAADMVAEMFTDRSGIEYQKATTDDASISEVMGASDGYAIRVTVDSNIKQPFRIVNATFGGE